MLLPHGLLVLVVDGSRMQLLRNDGGEANPQWTIVESAQQHVPPSRTLETEQAGRAFESASPSSHGYDTVDRHELREEVFAHDALLHLRTHARAHAKAVLIAPPKLLGLVRKAMDKQLSSYIVAEFAKDLTHQNPAAIEAFLREQ